MIALKLAARNFFSKSFEINAELDCEVFSKLFDDIFKGIIEQSKRTMSLDLILDKKTGKNSVLKGQNESLPIYTT